MKHIFLIFLFAIAVLVYSCNSASKKAAKEIQKIDAITKTVNQPNALTPNDLKNQKGANENTQLQFPEFSINFHNFKVYHTVDEGKIEFWEIHQKSKLMATSIIYGKLRLKEIL